MAHELSTERSDLCLVSLAKGVTGRGWVRPIVGGRVEQRLDQGVHVLRRGLGLSGQTGRRERHYVVPVDRPATVAKSGAPR